MEATKAPTQTSALEGETILASGLTYEEYVKQFMGDERRTEWVNGDVILIMNNVPHNRILFFLSQLVGLYLGLKPIGEALPAGISMYLEEQGRGREPDLLVVLNENKDRIQYNRIEGAADIAIEIVSPESRTRDYVFKYEEYEAGGVREYWLIDPLRQQADIYSLGEDRRYHRLPTDAQGRLVSTLLEGFALDPNILWSDNPPAGEALISLVKSMVAQPTEEQ